MLNTALDSFGEAEPELGAVILLTVGISAIVFRVLPGLFRATVARLEWSKTLYPEVVEPYQNLLAIALGLTAFDLLVSFLLPKTEFYSLLDIPLSLAVSGLVVWLIFSLSKLFFDVYLLNAAVREGQKINSEILILGKVTTLAGGIVVVIITFGQMHQINVVGLVASLGVGGLAIAFAAQKTLEQLLGTVVLYLDRPFVPGDHIRVTLNPHADDVYGRIESIGLRSTKLRTAAKSTLVIVPNSILANIDVENITRGKKVMVLLYLDFVRKLEEREYALVEQVVKASTNSLFGIDPGSTKIGLFELENRPGTRAWVTFFILGSSENSIQLRKRLLELANDTISKELYSV